MRERDSGLVLRRESLCLFVGVSPPAADTEILFEQQQLHSDKKMQRRSFRDDALAGNSSITPGTFLLEQFCCKRPIPTGDAPRPTGNAMATHVLLIGAFLR